MKSIVRVAVVVVAFAAAGCVSKVAQVSVAAAADSTLLYGEMHAAIPASKASGSVFEYN